MANIITSLRVVFSIAMLFFKPLSAGFFTMYFLAGFTDMIDGTVARKTGNVSELGSKLDTIADMVFFIITVVVLFPYLKLALWIWIWIAVIALVKILSIIYGYITTKSFVSVHSLLNRITGGALFIFPVFIMFGETNIYVLFICSIASVAAINEFVVVKKDVVRMCK